MALVSDLPLFAAMVPEELDDILAEARTRLYARNEVVFTQGEMPIRSSCCCMDDCARQIRTGEQIVVRFVGPGDIFGVAMALPSAPPIRAPQTRSSTASRSPGHPPPGGG